MKAYIITGAPGTGKTLLVKNLAKEGFIGLEEIPRKLIKERIAEKLGISPFKDLKAFATLVFNEMYKQYNSAIKVNNIIFFDRGLPDILGYLNKANLPVDRYILDTIKNCKFERNVFYCPAWEEIYVNDDERPYSYKEVEFLDKYLYEAYSSLDFNIIMLPKASVDIRKNFVLNYIS